MQASQREEVTVQEIARLVQSDPALMGRLLAQANAAATGLRPCVSVQDAVNRLGLQSTRTLALSFSLIDQYGQGNCIGFDYAGFWSQSLLMAVAMKQLGAPLKLGSADELFSCGLLARVGCLALATAYPVEYAAILAQGGTAPALLAREHSVLLTNHLQMSAQLQAQWGIPATLMEPIECMEDPSASTAAHSSRGWSLQQLMHLAWRLSNFLLDKCLDPSHELSELILLVGKLGLTAETFNDCVDSITQRWRALAQQLKVQSVAIAPFAQLAQARVRPDHDANTTWLRVLIVEDDDIICRMLQTWLQDQCHYTVQTASNGREALTLAADFNPHVILTDWMMPVMNGLELCKTLRASEWGHNIYVLMLTSKDSESELVKAFDHGVDDYLTKPVHMRTLSARLKSAWRFVRLRDAWERDHERPLCVISLDIDHFKSINDRFGHASGDLVLQSVSQSLRSAARREDTVCRWGGEEFLLICPNLEQHDAAMAAERLRSSIADHTIQVEGKVLQVTASIGVAHWHDSVPDPDHLIAQADRALYAAKAAGRNRVVTAWTLGPAAAHPSISPRGAL
jgi:diguanylate cyclase (GGDEF)-like protein